MHALITCSGCQKQLRIPAEALGKMVKCPLCTATFLAQEAGQPAPAAAAPAATPRPSAAPAAAPKPAAPVPPPPKPTPAPAPPPAESEPEEPWAFATSRRVPAKHWPDTSPSEGELSGEPNAERGGRPTRPAAPKSLAAPPWFLFALAALPLGILLVGVIGGRGVGMGWLGTLCLGVSLSIPLTAICMVVSLINRFPIWLRALISGGLAFGGYVAALFLILVGFIVGKMQIDPSLWKEYSSPEGRFTVMMPGTPTRSRKPIAGTQAETYSVILRRPDIGFHIQHFDVHGPFAGDFAQLARDDVRETFPKGRIVNERPVTIGSHSGREFQVEMAPNITVVRRIYLVGGRMYYVTVSGSRLSFDSPEIRKFLDSFQIHGPGGRPIDKDKARPR